MTYDDSDLYESWNTEIKPGQGDNSPSIIRTRSFSLANQCEYGPIFEFQESFIRENNSVYHLMMADRHWSDPVYYPC